MRNHCCSVLRAPSCAYYTMSDTQSDSESFGSRDAVRSLLSQIALHGGPNDPHGDEAMILPPNVRLRCLCGSLRVGEQRLCSELALFSPSSAFSSSQHRLDMLLIPLNSIEIFRHAFIAAELVGSCCSLFGAISAPHPNPFSHAASTTLQSLF